MGEDATNEAAGSSPAAAPAPAPEPARATLVVGLLALALSIVGWTRIGSDAFVIDQRAFWGSPWRLFGAQLVHPYVVQLLLCLAGLWYFGREVERRLGTVRMLGVCAVLALGIAFAEQAFDHGGSGLSGIVFGLWALLVVGGWRAPALRVSVPWALSLLMVAAFVLCLITGPVSTWGHGAGVLLGAFAGLCLGERGSLRAAFAPLALLLLAALAAGATLWRTSWNRGGASVEYDRAGFDALQRGDEPEAERLLRLALAFDPRDGQAWWNLCCVLDRLDRKEEAADACWRAYENLGFDEQQRAYLEDIQRRVCNAHIEADELKQAFPFAIRIAKLAPDELEVWETLRALAAELDEQEWQDLAERECARLAPDKK